MSQQRFLKMQIGNYELVVKDYRYRSRPPVAVRVSGTTLGERTNGFGEPCYFFKCDEAMSMTEGIARGKAIVAAQQQAVEA